MTPPYPGLPQVCGPPRGADYKRTPIKKGTRRLRGQEIVSHPGRDLKLRELQKRQDALDVLDAQKREEDNDIIMEDVAMAESSSGWEEIPDAHIHQIPMLPPGKQQNLSPLDLGQPKSAT